ncbi:hypothetical protein KFE25_002684 [Diacronema lutheri]|uniref:Enoyl reductase (ER) domain-containing protein n=1 Tax=Diacronema lutheri TaxID=2081491 RepID=A0A7R9UQT9_DIALT|nr:hypothetical protein KFE25_002684 [Diacronema lutheri]|mmetsp:Transcript_20803/g.64713  ORF Transcript_20803/g.64713 Transcript_20803/m.64713 type:complete len:368 (+) Transcript_20803:2-1105(+)
MASSQTPVRASSASTLILLMAGTAAAAEGTCPTTNRAVLLRKRPTGQMSGENVQLVELPKPAELADGEVLVRNLYASLDPTQRIWASDDPQYMAPTPLDEPIRAFTLGQVERSKDPALPEGSYVTGVGNIQSYYKTSAQQGATQVSADPQVPLTAHLSVLSVVIGLTAWIGVHDILGVAAGETVVISAASGAVGSLAGQLAKLLGARVIGIVGSDEKARLLIDEYGFDAALNRKVDEPTLIAQLREAAPNGVDAYFDNTGGVSTEAVLHVVNNNARVALCGVISGYNTGDMSLRNFQMLLHRRVMVKGFICVDHIGKYAQAKAELSELVRAGKLKYREDIQEGLENYVPALNRLFDGSNSGKLLLKI